jgi:hypothetical protein
VALSPACRITLRASLRLRPRLYFPLERLWRPERDLGRLRFRGKPFAIFIDNNYSSSGFKLHL